MAATVDYVSASTNRHSHAADASSSSLVAFGSAKLIALWNTEDPHDRGVYETLPGHEGLVTSVRFIDEARFVSADDKGVWKSTCVVQAHEKSVSALAVHGTLLVTGASDSTVKTWQIEHAQDAGMNRAFLPSLEETQAIILRGRYPLSLAVTTLPGTQAIILAIGGTDRSVQVWTRSEGQFVNSAVLSGHEDWIRALAFRPPQADGDPLILASGSQDATIRLWNVEALSSKSTEGSTSEVSDDLLDAFEASLGDLGEVEEGGRQISLNDITRQFSIIFDALLIGHEAGVSSLSWRPPSIIIHPTLLSTSTILAHLCLSIWINRQRFGDVGGQRLGGFVGGLWTREGMEASAWGWSGGWRRWRCTPGGDAAIPNVQNEAWAEVGAISGHNAPVRGLSWSPGGEYLCLLANAQTSLDQTTRIHAGYLLGGPTTSLNSTWHEVGRPQVHGYDLVGVASLDALRFVSIADEKVARVDNLDVAKLSDGETRAATVAPLQLSNKAVTEIGSDVTEYTNSYDLIHSKRRPFEGELAAITLWPEIEKVFGHGYESISSAVSSSKKLFASACKATTPEHAVVRVYDTEKWQPFGQPLAGHTLTVTRIAFSPDDRYVLTVSRDRHGVSLSAMVTVNGYVPLAADRSHARIIWDCAWAPQGDIFATASRDKTVRIWRQQDPDKHDKWIAIATLKMTEAATAVTFARSDSGEILAYSSSADNPTLWVQDLTLDSKLAHVDHIHHLACRPSDDPASVQLASCSEDNTLKILSVRIV
ncbi:WD40-repeat-containing domain protein [Fomitopsis serialis]|uniref:WD40-repeat-containing domain protein n=1 Tax=Fomitopsis serialis TaxID=139415 RepID=UPI002007A6B7|nr:WD40-repeat-containing domain protein [Neoantrodia serialis]KAH9938447.1 WD40-repeat-containing domain protein [Neoantrodia serialis]